MEKIAQEVCKWYTTCPIRTFTEQGKLEPYWVEHYCMRGNKHCVRFRMQENGEYHPDNMLPDGTKRDDL